MSQEKKIQSIFRASAQYYGITYAEIVGKSSSNKISTPRKNAIYLSIEEGFSGPSVASAIGRPKTQGGTFLDHHRDVQAVATFIAEPLNTIKKTAYKIYFKSC